MNVTAANFDWADYDNDGNMELIICGINTDIAGFNHLTKIYNTQTNSIKSIDEISNFVKLYPNPTSHQLTIETALKVSKINIIDVTGKIIKTINTNTNTIDVSDLSNGIYSIKLITKEKTITNKFVKK
jgi:hypothetical protein